MEKSSLEGGKETVMPAAIAKIAITLYSLRDLLTCAVRGSSRCFPILIHSVLETAPGSRYCYYSALQMRQ